MNRNLIFDALDYVDDDLLREVEALRMNKKVSRIQPWIKWASMAACFCIIAGGVLVWQQMYDSAETETTAEGNMGDVEMIPEYTDEEDGSDSGDRIYKQEVSIKWFESLGDCMKNADFVLTCTIQEIGEAYAENSVDSIGMPGGSGELDYIRSIRTPITLVIENVFYDSTNALGKTLTVTENCGTVGRYTLESPFPMLEEGKNYLLFIAQAPDGETNVMIGQASVLLDGENFMPLMNENVYSAWKTMEELLEAVRITAEEKEANE